MEPGSPTWEGQSLGHWTTREVLEGHFYIAWFSSSSVSEDSRVVERIKRKSTLNIPNTMYIHVHTCTYIIELKEVWEIMIKCYIWLTSLLSPFFPLLSVSFKLENLLLTIYYLPLFLASETLNLLWKNITWKMLVMSVCCQERVGLDISLA